jgi:hypothetical protein
VKIGQCATGFFFFATAGEQDWQGVTSAPTRESALLGVFSRVRAGLDVTEPIRILLTLPADSRIWRHVKDLAALGYLVERADSRDQLMAAAQAGLSTLHAQIPANLRRSTSTQGSPAPVPETTVPGPITELTVATDGSVRKGGGPARKACAGSGWLADDGRYGLRGTTDKISVIGQQAVLVAELAAIGDAVRSLPAHSLTVLSDSKAAVAIVKQW